MEVELKQSYDVLNEMQEYSPTDEEFKSTTSSKSVKSRPTNDLRAMKIITFIFMGVSILLLLLITFMVAVVAYDVRVEPTMCVLPTTTNTSTSSAVTGAPQCCNTTVPMTNDTQVLLQRVNLLINKTEQILSFYDMQAAHAQNNTNTLEDSLDIVKDSATLLNGIVSTLSNLENNSLTDNDVSNDILSLVDQLYNLQYRAPQSCQEIKQLQPNSASGYYYIDDQSVYCEIGTLCNSEGVWTRLGYLNMSDSTYDCPSGFNLYNLNGDVRACGRFNGDGGSCKSIQFQSLGSSYTEVCGRVEGYYYKTNDALNTGINNINSPYVDGVSITQGDPRQHIWTLIAGGQTGQNHGFNCPCNKYPGADHGQIDLFIGDDYFCDAVNPLWDGEGCNGNSIKCCEAPGIPWFHRTGLTTTTDYLELRVCGNQDPTDEDAPVGFYEIYVK